jgi:polysaccharide export outer membrane protein
MRSRSLRLLPFLVLGWLASLSGAETPPAPPAAGATDYVMQPSDLIRVMIFQEPDLLREVRITQEYTITLPLIGTIDLRDRTVRQAEEIIRSLYDKDYLVNPQVNLTVLEYTQRTVQVVGAVNQPGAVVFPPEQKMGLIEAIARAGGQSRIADLKRVRLTRTNAEGRAENQIINVDDMMKGNSNEQYLLQKGDVIFVPERLL